jgi:hypothetical protein
MRSGLLPSAGGYNVRAGGRRVGSPAQNRDRGPEMGAGIIEELDYERMAVQGLLHDTALNTLSAPVDQANGAQAGLMRRIEVLLDDRRNISGGEGVEVEAVPDGDRHRILLMHGYARSTCCS